MTRNPGLGLVQVREGRRTGVVDASKSSFYVPSARIGPMHSRQPHEDRDEKPISEDKLAFLVIAARGNLNGL